MSASAHAAVLGPTANRSFPIRRGVPEFCARSFNLISSVLGLLLLSPLLLLVALAVKLTSRGPVFFRQERVGKEFQPFWIYKFRTMVSDAPRRGAAITVGNDPRVTRIGRWLRKTKIDEIPQLINVLKGEMNLVGPRPEVLRYVEMFRDDYAEILQVRPGMTDEASLKYCYEAHVLGEAADPEEAYVRYVLPDKIRLAKQYLGRATFLSDLSLILRTVFRLLGLKARVGPVPPVAASGDGRGIDTRSPPGELP